MEHLIGIGICILMVESFIILALLYVIIAEIKCPDKSRERVFCKDCIYYSNSNHLRKDKFHKTH